MDIRLLHPNVEVKSILKISSASVDWSPKCIQVDPQNTQQADLQISLGFFPDQTRRLFQYCLATRLFAPTRTKGIYYILESLAFTIPRCSCIVKASQWLQKSFGTARKGIRQIWNRWTEGCRWPFILMRQSSTKTPLSSKRPLRVTILLPRIIEFHLMKAPTFTQPPSVSFGIVGS